MAKVKINTTKKAPKKRARKGTSKKSVKPLKWDETHKAVARLLEGELEGLIQYLRGLHFSALVLILGSLFAVIYALRMLFENGQHAVIGTLVMIATGFAVIIASTFVLRPWILPRFLLPLDLNDLTLDELLQLFKDPNEYLLLLKNHIQILTDNFLYTKLRYLRNAIALLVFGLAVAIILSIALP